MLFPKICFQIVLTLTKKGAGGSTFVVHPPHVRWYVLYYDVKLQINFHTKIICAVLVYNGCFYFVFMYSLSQ